MNNSILILFLVASIFVSSCRPKNNCDQLPKQFSTYNEAVSKIEASYFKIKEDANTSKSSWIKDASFYSCDGISGYFILITDKKDYVYSDMPYNVWQEFKNAKSFGKFYNEKIKHRYIFQLTK